MLIIKGINLWYSSCWRRWGPEIQGVNLDVVNLDISNSDDLNSDGDDKLKTGTSKPDISDISVVEEKKLLWKNKIINPNRDQGLIKKIYSEKVVTREPGKRDMLGTENPRVYRCDT